MDSDNKQRIIAAAGTILFHLALLLILLFTWWFPSAEVETVPQWNKEDASLILYGDEYVAYGEMDVLTDDTSVDNPSTDVTVEGETATPPGIDMTDAGPEGETTNLIASANPSPMTTTVKPEDKPAGTVNPNPATEDKKPENKLSQENADRINNRVNFSDNSSNSSATGQAGSPDGGESGGTAAGISGHTLRGRSIASQPSFKAPARGTVTISVEVDGNGKVISARYVKSTISGSTASMKRTRELCEAMARKVVFSVLEGSPTQSGTITFKIG